jgi:hypothetical protein
LTTLAPLFVPEDVRDAVSDEAWLEAIADAERARINAACLAGDLAAGEAARLVEAVDPLRAPPEVIETAAMLVARDALALLGRPCPDLPALLDEPFFAEELDLAPYDGARNPFAELADALGGEWAVPLREARDWRVRCSALTEALAFAGAAHG